MARDPVDAVQALGWAIYRRDAVVARMEREARWLGEPTLGARTADRESQEEYMQAVADVYHLYGVDEQVFAEARVFAGLIRQLGGAIHGRSW